MNVPQSDPKAPPEVLTITKASAARTQLETAISLWFNYGDPVSILTLAAAAHDCYHAMGAHAGRPSLVQACLKSQSKQVQKSVHEAQNFVKHGRKNLKGAVSFRMKFAEVLMIDSVDCHQKLFGTQTPIMNAYFTRFMFENPQVVRAEHRASFFKGVDVYNIHKIPRGEFLEIALKASRKPPPTGVDLP